MEHVDRARRQVGGMVIVDNTPAPSSGDWLGTAVSGSEGVTLISNGVNAGVAKALNQGIRWAREAGFSWVLLLDQDTALFDDMVSTLIRAYSEFPERERLAVVGCSPFAEDTPAENNGTRWWTPAKVVITSGTLLSLDAAVKIGPFREEFFIDCVDFEFCLRARAAGYRIVEILKPVMRHVIGSPRRIRWQWVARSSSNHRPWRAYYITRNLVTVTREYLWKEPSWVVGAIYRRIKEMILLVLFEPARRQKMKYVMLGFYDGLTRRFDRVIS